MKTFLEAGKGEIIDPDYSLFMQEGLMRKERIKRIRRKYGMTQRKFAELLEVSYETYSSWERGVRNPSSPASSLLQIANKHPVAFLESRKEIIRGVMQYFGKV